MHSTREVNVAQSSGFLLIGAGTSGIATQRLLRPGYASVDSPLKNTKITERIGTQFRIEMFNLFNARTWRLKRDQWQRPWNHCGHHRRLTVLLPWPWRGVQHAAGAEDYLLALGFGGYHATWPCLALAGAFRRSVLLLVSEAQP